MEKLNWLCEEKDNETSDMEIRKLPSGISFKVNAEIVNKYTDTTFRNHIYFDIAFGNEIAFKFVPLKKGLLFSAWGNKNWSRGIGTGNKHYEIFNQNVGKYKLDRVEDNILYFKKEI